MTKKKSLHDRVKYSVYELFGGYCKICYADTLWGDAPHDPGCEFAIMVTEFPTIEIDEWINLNRRLKFQDRFPLLADAKEDTLDLRGGIIVWRACQLARKREL